MQRWYGLVRLVGRAGALGRATALLTVFVLFASTGLPVLASDGDPSLVWQRAGAGAVAETGADDPPDDAIVTQPDGRRARAGSLIVTFRQGTPSGQQQAAHSRGWALQSRAIGLNRTA